MGLSESMILFQVSRAYLINLASCFNDQGGVGFIKLTLQECYCAKSTHPLTFPIMFPAPSVGAGFRVENTARVVAMWVAGSKSGQGVCGDLSIE